MPFLLEQPYDDGFFFSKQNDTASDCRPVITTTKPPEGTPDDCKTKPSSSKKDLFVGEERNTHFIRGSNTLSEKRSLTKFSHYPSSYLIIILENVLLV